MSRRNGAPAKRKVVLWKHATKGNTIDTPKGRIFGVTREQAHKAVDEFFDEADKWKVSKGGRPVAADAE